MKGMVSEKVSLIKKRVGSWSGLSLLAALFKASVNYITQLAECLLLSPVAWSGSSLSLF